MLVYLNAAKCVGIDATPITVEIDISNGVGIHLVGLGDVAVKESLLRITTALSVLGYKIPGRRIVINLAPASLHKSGAGFDLPIAAGILAASEQVKPADDLKKFLIMGELGLDGSVRPITGVLPMVTMAREQGLDRIIVPADNAYEILDYTSGMRVYGVESLPQVMNILEGGIAAEECLLENCGDNLWAGRSRYHGKGIVAAGSGDIMDFSEIIGQSQAKRGIEIASAGSHNVLLVGSPGSGKSSLAKAMCRILPPMTKEESLVTRKIYSVAGIEPPVQSRPFRSPHYSSSLPSIIGGGSASVAPGEISLAHNGVLFIDEFCEAPSKVIEALRGPMEDGKVTISRIKSKVEYPSRFTLVAATNPCPCGYYGEGNRCTCTRFRREQYLSKLSGPMLDRIDLQIWTYTVDPKKLRDLSGSKPESSAEVAARVLAARQIQKLRLEGEGITCNGEMSNAQVRRFCKLTPEVQERLDGIMERMQFSVRAYFRILKVARTIADLDHVILGLNASTQEEAMQIPILSQHILEAASFRFLDKGR